MASKKEDKDFAEGLYDLYKLTNDIGREFKSRYELELNEENAHSEIIDEVIGIFEKQIETIAKKNKIKTFEEAFEKWKEITNNAVKKD